MEKAPLGSVVPALWLHKEHRRVMGPSLGKLLPFTSILHCRHQPRCLGQTALGFALAILVEQSFRQTGSVLSARSLKMTWPSDLAKSRKVDISSLEQSKRDHLEVNPLRGGRLVLREMNSATGDKLCVALHCPVP